MATIAAYEKNVVSISVPANADLSSYQYYAVKYSSGNLVVCTTQGERPLGILQDDPNASGVAGSVGVGGISRAILGGSVSQLDPLCVNSSGKLIKGNDTDEFVVGFALSDGVASDIIPILLTFSGSVASLAGGGGQQTFTSSADYSSTGQYLAMKIHTTAGQIVKDTTGGSSAMIGILQNAPAAAAEAEVAMIGSVCTAKAGTGGVAAGAELMVESSTGKLITATSGNYIVGYALAAITADANGSVLLVTPHLKSVVGVALTRGSIYRGSSAGLVEAFVAKTAGYKLIGDGTDVILAAEASTSDFNTPTISGGAIVSSLKKKLIRCDIVHFDSAAVIAMNATPCVILDHSAKVSSGEIVATDTLVYHGAVLQLDGGAAAYDQNQNTIAKYQTAGGGAAVSLTLANWFNGGADNLMSTLKPIATDVALEADQDIVLTSSASPKNAAGDRALNVAVYYSVYSRV